MCVCLSFVTNFASFIYMRVSQNNYKVANFSNFRNIGSKCFFIYEVICFHVRFSGFAKIYFSNKDTF